MSWNRCLQYIFSRSCSTFTCIIILLLILLVMCTLFVFKEKQRIDLVNWMTYSVKSIILLRVHSLNPVYCSCNHIPFFKEPKRKNEKRWKLALKPYQNVKTTLNKQKDATSSEKKAKGAIPKKPAHSHYLLGRNNRLLVYFFFPHIIFVPSTFGPRKLLYLFFERTLTLPQ